ncbi:19881_t:CDS:2, partial [Cetraspora pellucida]
GVWKRKAQTDVCLKGLDNSKDIKREFLEENPKDGNYMMVMEYAKQGSLRKLLDSKYGELDWVSKVANLFYIAELANALYQFYDNLKNEETELYKQIKEVKDSYKSFSIYDQIKSARLNYQTDPQAIYTSRLLKFLKLPKPGNNIY